MVHHLICRKQKEDSDLSDIAESIVFNMIQYIATVVDESPEAIVNSLKADDLYDDIQKQFSDIVKETPPTIVKIKKLQENPSLTGLAKLAVLIPKLKKTLGKMQTVMESIGKKLK